MIGEARQDIHYFGADSVGALNYAYQLEPNNRAFAMRSGSLLLFVARTRDALPYIRVAGSGTGRRSEIGTQLQTIQPDRSGITLGHYRSNPPYLAVPRIYLLAQRIGMAAAWDKYGWPDLLTPLGNL